ncbi:hypothetical protein U1763_02400 [Sphingomonas sp. LB2R24]|uniref:hypothetical protein n=1 Tax=Sphingomonas sorbitolis TaxID=3096165 RepID=UPI002FC6CD51
MLIYVTGFWLLLFVLTAIAWWGRDRNASWRATLSQPEIGVATLLMAAALLTVAMRPSFATRFAGLDIGMLTIDVALFGGLAAYGARTGRWWVLAAAALQLVSATAHVTRMVTPGMWRLGYQVMEEASSYPTLMLLGWGLWSRHRIARNVERSRTFSIAQDRGRAGRRA